MWDFLSSEAHTHPVLVSGIARFQLVHIHPFLNGNGRTSRLLSTPYLYRARCDFKRLFTISEYYDRNRPAIYRTIQGVREAGMGMTGRMEFYVDGLSTLLEFLVLDFQFRLVNSELVDQCQPIGQ
jgi:Fic family protein